MPTAGTSTPESGQRDRRQPLRPPNKHELALMIWIAVFPTLTVLSLLIGPMLANQHPVLRTLVLATIAVPIVIYGLMPQLHRLRSRLLGRPTAG